MPVEVCAGAVFVLPGERNVGGGQHNARHWRRQRIDFNFSETFRHQKPDTPKMPKVEQAAWLLLWIQQRAANIKELEHLTHNNRLREVVLVGFKQERLEGAIFTCTNTQWKDVKWHWAKLFSVVFWREAGGNGHKFKQGKFHLKVRKIFFAQSSQTLALQRLWSVHPCRQSKLNWARSSEAHSSRHCSK